MGHLGRERFRTRMAVLLEPSGLLMCLLHIYMAVPAACTYDSSGIDLAFFLKGHQALHTIKSSHERSIKRQDTIRELCSETRREKCESKTSFSLEHNLDSRPTSGARWLLLLPQLDLHLPLFLLHQHHRQEQSAPPPFLSNAG